MSNADEIVLTGTYTSPNKTYKFQVSGSPHFIGLIDEHDKDVYSQIIANVVPSYTYRKSAIKMSEDEFQFFKNEVLDKNVPWNFRGVEIPGTWSTSGVSVGGKRSSYRRSSCKRSSCRRSSCKRSSCRRGHRRTKHH